jgi:hypothetical protein
MKIPFLLKLLIVILLTIALSEFAPELVNYVLLLILIGAILGNWQEFKGLATILSLKEV